MKTLQIVFCWAFLAVQATPEEGKVLVVNSESRDLKRTAYRLHIPPERLKNARQALEEATELAKRVRPVQVTVFSQLSRHWVPLHRNRARAALKELISSVRSSAADAREQREFTSATAAVRPLLAELAQLDPDEALLLARQWPEPSKTLGETARRARTEMETQFRLDALQRIAHTNPEGARKLWPEGEQTATADLAVRARMAEALAHSGRKDQALKLLDQSITDLGAAQSNAVPLSDAMQLVQTVARLAPDRFLEALKLLAVSAANVPAAGPASMKLDDQLVTLDNAEAVTLQLFTSWLRESPTLTMKTVEAMPALKAKLEGVGGIDAVLSGRVELSYADGTGMQSTTMFGSSASDPDASLYLELRGKALNEPGVVRDRLASIGPSQPGVQSLLTLASVASSLEPELSSIALETARKLISRIEPITTKAQLFAFMVSMSRRIEGEVDTDVFKQGFVLVAEMREQQEKEQEHDPATASRPRGSPADMLEKTLIAELAIDDFDAAIRYVGTMPDEPTRLTTLLMIIDRCRRPF